MSLEETICRYSHSYEWREDGSGRITACAQCALLAGVVENYYNTNLQ